MVEFGYASKYNPVGWKATIPDTSDIVDAICCVGDVVVLFQYDEIYGSFVCKQGMAKKPSQIWAAMPDGGSFTAHVPCIGYNELLGGALRLRYVSGSTYYPWLMQAGDARYVNESVFPATVGVSDPYSGYAVRLFEPSTLSPATYTYIYSDYNTKTPSNTAYLISISKTRQISFSPASIRTFAHPSDRYITDMWGLVGLGAEVIASAYAAGKTKYVFIGVSVSSATNPCKGVIKYPDDSIYVDGSGDEVYVAHSITLDVGNTITYTWPSSETDPAPVWYSKTVAEMHFSSAELRLYIGNEYKVLETYSCSPGTNNYIQISGYDQETNISLIPNVMAQNTSNYFASFGPYVTFKWKTAPNQSTNHHFRFVGRSSWTYYGTWTWNGARWVGSATTTVTRGVPSYVYGPSEAISDGYRRWLYDFKSDALVSAQTSSLIDFADCECIAIPPLVYFPHFGVGSISGATLTLYKNGDPLNAESYTLNDTLIWNFPQYVKYVDPDDGGIKHRYSLKAQGSIINITFDETFSSPGTMTVKPFEIVYSDGTKGTMARAWTAVADITGGGMFSYDLITAGAKILDMY